jgi:hypothetical protein
MWAALVSASLPAHAANLTWSAPPDCAVEADLREQAERLIGQGLDSVQGIEFAVEVRRKSASSWLLRLSTSADGERGQRELTAASCAEVVEAGAVAIAMAVQGRIDEPAHQSTPEPAPPLEDKNTAPPAPSALEQLDASRPLAGTAARSTAVTARLAIALGATTDAGALPAASPGVELDATLDIGALRALALGALYAPQSRDLAAERGGEFSLMLAGLLACLRKPANGWTFFGCGGFELGVLSGKGEGDDVSESTLGSYVWRAARAELGASAAVSARWALMLRAGVAAPLLRRPFVLGETELVHRPSSLAARAFLGIQVQL